MSFEELFPSLKGKAGCHASPACEMGRCGCLEVDINDIEEFCLDKAKVREAIAKYSQNETGTFRIESIDEAIGFFKMLGME